MQGFASSVVRDWSRDWDVSSKNFAVSITTLKERSVWKPITCACVRDLFGSGGVKISRKNVPRYNAPSRSDCSHKSKKCELVRQCELTLVEVRKNNLKDHEEKKLKLKNGKLKFEKKKNEKFFQNKKNFFFWVLFGFVIRDTALLTKKCLLHRYGKHYKYCVMLSPKPCYFGCT